MEELYNENDTPLNVEDAQVQSLMTLAETAASLTRAVNKIAAYVPTQWVDNSEPSINANRLMHIENGIRDATNAVNNAIDAVTAANSAINTINSNLTNNSKAIIIPNGSVATELPNYYTQGKICIVFGNVYIANSTGSNVHILGTGLPIPYIISGWVWGTLISNADQKVHRIGINPNGEICAVYQNIPAGEYTLSNLAYFINK